MELLYCEECGDIIQVATSAPRSAATERFVCEKCRETKPGTPAATPRREAPPPRTTADPAGVDIEKLLRGKDLDLFSKRTIVARKEAAASQRESAASASAGTPDGETTQPLTSPSRPQPARQGSSARVEKPAAGVSVVAAEIASDADGLDADSVGSAVPAPRAQKIAFRCVHCRTPVSIRPVLSTSRLECPSCTNIMYVTVSGQILKSMPSEALRKSGSTRVALRSAPAARQGSDTRPRPPATPAERGDVGGAIDDSPPVSTLRSAGLRTSNPSGKREGDAGSDLRLGTSALLGKVPGSRRGGTAAAGAEAQASSDDGLLNLQFELDADTPEAPAAPAVQPAPAAAVRQQRSSSQSAPDSEAPHSRPRPGSDSEPTHRPGDSRRRERASAAATTELEPSSGVGDACLRGAWVKRRAGGSSPLRATTRAFVARGLLLAFALVLPVWVVLALTGAAPGRGAREESWGPLEEPRGTLDVLGARAVRGTNALLENFALRK